MQDSQKEYLVELLKDLFGRINGCPDSDCIVCSENRDKIQQVGNIIGLSQEDLEKVMPFHLKTRR